MTVYLVGAGPGDPELLTVKAVRLLETADVVVYDALLDRSVLDLAPAAARRIDVGKRRGQPVAQEAINEMLVTLGRAHPSVVRLKGGDPFVFGRGGEEALALADAGVAFVVVPGVSSAIAAPAAAGVPVTHRGMSAAFTVVTGHRDPTGTDDTDWDALARVGGTVVIVMGVAHRAEIAAKLMASGRAPTTPVAAVRWATTGDQQVVRTTLAELGSTRIESPATIVIGRVAALDLRSPMP